MTQRLESGEDGRVRRGSFVDVESREIGQKPRMRRSARQTLLLGACGLTSAFALGWLGYLYAFRPWQDKREFLDAMQRVSSLATPEQLQSLRAMESSGQRERYLLSSASLLEAVAKKSGQRDLASGAKAALSLAIRDGSVDAMIESGIAERDGSLGPANSSRALEQFEKAVKANDAGLRVGDPDPYYLQAKMLALGLGVPADRAKATELAERAADSMSSWRLDSLFVEAMMGRAPFGARQPVKVLKGLLDRNIKRSPGSYVFAQPVCERERQETYGTTSSRNVESFEAAQRCIAEFSRKAAEAGDTDAMGDYASFQVSAGGDIESARRWFSQARDKLSATEKFKFGILQMATDAGSGAQRDGYLMARDALQQAENEAIAKGTSPAVGVSEPTHYHLWLFGLEKVLAPENDVRKMRQATVTVRAIADATNTVDVARRALKEASPFEELAAHFDDGPIKRAALELMQGIPVSDAVAMSSFESVSAAVVADKERQSASGYVPGALLAATGGHSTFTVDNSAGQADAIARLYIDGKKPAVRSFYIRTGDQFTVRGIAEGAYVLRYRLIGSPLTYEASDKFELSAVRTAAGIRYSTVKVTLYKLPSGNLDTRTVSDDQF